MAELKDFYNEVARVAYDLYEKRGRIHGHDLEDWLKAETMVKNRYENERRPEAGVIAPDSGSKAAGKRRK